MVDRSEDWSLTGSFDESVTLPIFESAFLLHAFEVFFEVEGEVVLIET